jgi:predicted metal-dependent hydrolase
MNIDTIRVFAISKLGWIRKQQEKMRSQEREAPREYLDRESRYLWGKRYLFKVEHQEAAPAVQVLHSRIVLTARPDIPEDKKRAIVAEWYRGQLKDTVPLFIAKWEPLIGVKVAKFFVQSMKTRWGNCNPKERRIRLNTELAKKPRECLEYIVVHEMVHLLEPTHNRQFVALMDRFMPKWHFYRDVLSRLPVRHERWEY